MYLNATHEYPDTLRLILGAWPSHSQLRTALHSQVPQFRFCVTTTQRITRPNHSQSSPHSDRAM